MAGGSGGGDAGGGRGGGGCTGGGCAGGVCTGGGGIMLPKSALSSCDRLLLGGPACAVIAGGGGGGDDCATVALRGLNSDASDQVRDVALLFVFTPATRVATALLSSRATTSGVKFAAVVFNAQPGQASVQRATTAVAFPAPETGCPAMGPKANVFAGEAALKLARNTDAAPTARGAWSITFHWYSRHKTADALPPAGHTPSGSCTSYDTSTACTSAGSSVQKVERSSGVGAAAAAAVALCGSGAVLHDTYSCTVCRANAAAEAFSAAAAVGDMPSAPSAGAASAAACASSLAGSAAPDSSRGSSKVMFVAASVEPAATAAAATRASGVVAEATACTAESQLFVDAGGPASAATVGGGGAAEALLELLALPTTRAPGSGVGAGAAVQAGKSEAADAGSSAHAAAPSTPSRPYPIACGRHSVTLPAAADDAAAAAASADTTVAGGGGGAGGGVPSNPSASVASVVSAKPEAQTAHVAGEVHTAQPGEQGWHVPTSGASCGVYVATSDTPATCAEACVCEA